MIARITLNSPLFQSNQFKHFFKVTSSRRIFPLKSSRFIFNTCTRLRAIRKRLCRLIFSSHTLLNVSSFLFLQIIASPSLRGWYDASTESSNWMKNIRSAEECSTVNIQHIFINGQVSSRNFGLSCVEYSIIYFLRTDLVRSDM